MLIPVTESFISTIILIFLLTMLPFGGDFIFTTGFVLSAIKLMFSVLLDRPRVSVAFT